MARHRLRPPAATEVLVAAVVLFQCCGCSVGSANFRLVDAASNEPLTSRQVMWTRGSGTTSLGYAFCTLETDAAGELRDIRVYDGDVFGFDVAGYAPVEVHAGYRSMTVSESVGNIRLGAMLQKSAREIPFGDGGTVTIPLRPLTATPATQESAADARQVPTITRNTPRIPVTLSR